MMFDENQPFAECFYILPRTIRSILQMKKLRLKEGKVTPCITVLVKSSEKV